MADGSYDITLITPDGYVSTLVDALAVDTTLPSTPEVDALVTNVTSPTLTGRADPDAVLTVTVNGMTYTSGIDSALTLNPDGTWQLDLSGEQTLGDGIYDISLTSTDAAGNTASDVTSNELTIDSDTPAITVTAQITDQSRPVITGTVSDTLAEVTDLTIEVNGTIYTLADSILTYDLFPSGVWQLDLSTSSPMADGSYEVIASVTDAAGNTGADTTNNELIIDTEVPQVTVNGLTTNSTQPVITGTATDANGISALTVTVDGVTYTLASPELSIDGSGNWSLDLAAVGGAGNTLTDDSYEIVVNATDGAMNVGSDGSSLEVYVDTIAPVVIANDLTTEDTTPILTGTTSEPYASLTVTVAGRSYVLGTDDELTLDVATPTPLTTTGWTLDLSDRSPVLNLGSYTISVVAEDIATNNSGVSNGLLEVVAAPTVVDLATNSLSPTLTGTVDLNDDLTVIVDGISYTAADTELTINGDGSWQLDLATAGLSGGDYPVTIRTAGGDRNGLLAISGPTEVFNPPASFADIRGPIYTNDDTPLLTGTGPANSTIDVVVNMASYSVSVGADGSWSQVLPSLSDGNYTIEVTTATGAVTRLENGLAIDSRR